MECCRVETEYARQDRGTDEAYQRYLAGMDQSMRQKVALTAAHLLGEGTVADMGMGSGSGSYALASLYPRLRVVGVDVNQEMVERATARFKLPNLSFTCGDVAEPVFPEGSLHGIFDSSVLHHVTSFNGYDQKAAVHALVNQVTQLAFGGSVIVRDFVAPPPGHVLLDLPHDDGDDSANPSTCSSARLLERFATEFRRLDPEPGFHLERVEQEVPGAPLRPNWRRYLLSHRHAAEFLLRKDYRADWDSEVLEEYAYFTQEQFEQVFAELGLRLLGSMPIANPWIVKHRFVGKAALWSEAGEPLPFPPTNYLIAAERVPPSEGVRFEMGAPQTPTGFLTFQVFEHRDTGALRDLVRRPGTTLDVVPWFEDQNSLFVLVRRSHPRPVLQAQTLDVALDGMSPVGYVTEPILAIMSDKPVGMAVEEAVQEAAGIPPEQIRTFVQGGHYYPSPGGLMEVVQTVYVEVAPCYVGQTLGHDTGFSTAGSVRAVGVQQVLRAAQVGALPDARLELSVYELLLTKGIPPGPWIGADVELQETENVSYVPLASLSLPNRRAYRPCPSGSHAGFLQLRCHEFAEKGPQGQTLHRGARDYVVPATLSANTVACALLKRQGDTVLIGLDEDDLPAVQAFTGQSGLWVTPAWRLPNSCRSQRELLRWVGERIECTYGLRVESSVELGGRYHPSAGVTPEVVYPYAMQVHRTASVPSRLRFVPLLDLVQQLHRIQDGHLRILSLRAAHALSLLG